MSNQELRVMRHGLFQQPYCLPNGFGAARVEGHHLIKLFCAQIPVVRDKIRCGRLLNGSFLSGRKRRLKLIRDCLGYVCLNRKNIIEWPIVPFRPDMPVTPRIN